MTEFFYILCAGEELPDCVGVCNFRVQYALLNDGGRDEGESQLSKQRSPVPRRVIQLDDPRHDAQRSVSICISLNI